MRKCGPCGVELPPQARFCGKCGTPFYETAPSNEPVQPALSGSQAVNPEYPGVVTTYIPGEQLSLPCEADEDGEFENTPPENSEDGHQEQPADLAGPTSIAPPAGIEALPTPHLPSIQCTPRFSSGPMGQIMPSMIGRPASPSFRAHNLVGNQAPAPGTGSSAPSYFSSYTAHTGATQNARGCVIRWLVISLAAILVAVGGGIGILSYILTRPQPVIGISSAYQLGNTPVGSNGTSLYIQGRRFSGKSVITFLIDNRPAPAAPRVVSDQNGNISAKLPITAAWPQGRHILTARDASNYVSKVGIAIEVVPQGQAHTPGPNGAPPDDANFTVNASLHGQYDEGNGPFSGTEPLIITGYSDPAGGSVCKARDNGQPQTYHGITPGNGLPYVETVTFSCTGTYKGGQISYAETLLSAEITLTYQGNQYICHLLTPGVNEKLSGSYKARNGFSGTETHSSFPQSDFSCTTGQLDFFTFSIYGGTSTWNGAAVPH